jgi:hypothetical protein
VKVWSCSQYLDKHSLLSKDLNLSGAILDNVILLEGRKSVRDE